MLFWDEYVMAGAWAVFFDYEVVLCWREWNTKIKETQTSNTVKPNPGFFYMKERNKFLFCLGHHYFVFSYICVFFLFLPGIYFFSFFTLLILFDFARPSSDVAFSMGPFLTAP